MFYVVSMGVVAIGLTFAAIPAYRMFCEATSFGGLTQVGAYAYNFIYFFRLQKTWTKSLQWKR